LLGKPAFALRGQLVLLVGVGQHFTREENFIKDFVETVLAAREEAIVHLAVTRWVNTHEFAFVLVLIYCLGYDVSKLEVAGGFHRLGQLTFLLHLCGQVVIY
jgi:hypothetical protein